MDSPDPSEHGANTLHRVVLELGLARAVGVHPQLRGVALNLAVILVHPALAAVERPDEVKTW